LFISYVNFGSNQRLKKKTKRFGVFGAVITLSSYMETDKPAKDFSEIIVYRNQHVKHADNLHKQRGTN